MSSRVLHGTLLALTGLLAACKSDRQAASGAPAAAVPTPTTVIVTATDFALSLPPQVTAGAVTFHLVNSGVELHQAQLIKLEEGKTIVDFAEAMRHEGPPPSWVKFLGGPNGIAPGQETSTTEVVTPGQYAVLCLIPSPDGVIHVMKGMIQPFEVVAATGPVADALPAADDTIRVADYTFEPTHPLTRGHHAILVENIGPQPHEIVLVKLATGKSVDDFGKWAEGGMKGPPPALPMGGVVVLDPGGRGVFTADLASGDYGFICFVPDAKDGKPHLMHGMIKQFKVG